MIMASEPVPREPWLDPDECPHDDENLRAIYGFIGDRPGTVGKVCAACGTKIK